MTIAERPPQGTENYGGSNRMSPEIQRQTIIKEHYEDDLFQRETSGISLPENIIFSDDYGDPYSGNNTATDLIQAYALDIGKIDLLSRKEEIRFGKEIFDAQLSLHNLDKIREFLPLIPDAKRQEVLGLLSTGRGKYLFDEFNANLESRPKTIEKKEKAGVNASSLRLLLEDVKTNDLSVRAKTEEWAAIEDSNRLKQDVLKFTQEQLDSYCLGNKAFDSLFHANLPMVISIAKVYQKLTLMDNTQEGNLGLMKAAARFDFRLGTRFSTSATRWIRQFIRRAIADTAQTIRIPVHAGEILTTLYREKKEMEQEKGRSVKISEVAERLGFNPEIVRQAAATRRILSLDMPLKTTDPYDNSDYTLGDAIADETNVVTLTEEEDIRQQMRSILRGILDERSATVVERLSGLEDGKDWSLKEIGDEMQRTRERVRQIKVQAAGILDNNRKKIHDELS